MPPTLSYAAAEPWNGNSVDDAFRPEEILAALAAQNVRFVLIGGMAAILHGDAGVTVDLDIVPAGDAENLDRLAAALRGLNARIRTEGEPNGLPFDCSATFLSNLGPDALLNLTTCAGDMDIVLMPAGTRGFNDLRQDAVAIDTAGIMLLVASLPDIIRSKAAADRDKDRQALPRLRALLERSRR